MLFPNEKTAVCGVSSAFTVHAAFCTYVQWEGSRWTVLCCTGSTVTHCLPDIIWQSALL